MNLLSERQKAFKTIFTSIKEIFPFQSKKDFFNFKKLYNKYFEKIKALPEDDQYFFLHIEQFLASFKNSHTKLGNYPTKIFFKPRGYSVLFLNKRFYLRRGAKIIGEILSIDSEEPIEILNFNIRRISSSTKQYSIDRALTFMLLSQKNEPARLKIKRMDGKIRIATFKREKTESVPLKKIVEAKTLKEFIGYLKINAWAGEDTKSLIDKAINYFLRKKTRVLIVDVRNNGGGNSNIARHLAGHLFSKRVLFGITKQRVSKNNFKLKTNRLYIEPIKPCLTIPIILLINWGCFSSNEYFIAGLKDNNRAYIIGETTGGGSGNPKKFVIPYRKSSFELLVSTWQYYRPNKMLLEGKGIRPHLVVRPVLQDFIKRHDQVLEAAVKKAKKLKDF